MFSQSDSLDFYRTEAKEFKEIGFLDKAIIKYNYALNFISDNNKKETARIYSDIASIYHQTKDNEKALEMLIRASHIQRELKDDIGLASSYNTYGLIYKDKKDFTKAIEYFETASLIFETYNLNDAKSKILLHLGETYLIIDDQNKSSLYLNDSKKLALEFSSILHVQKVNVALTKLYLSNNEFNDANNLITQIDDYALKNDNLKLKIETSLLKSKLNEKQGNHNKALEYLKDYNLKKNELLAINSSKSTKEAQSKFILDDQGRTLELQTQEIESQQKALEKSKLITYLTIAFLILMSVFSYVLFRGNKQRKKSYSVLKIKNKELIRAKKRAEEASIAKAQFLSTVTHELRTPLYAVTGLTDILLDKNPSIEQKQHLESLKFSGDYLLNFINDILHVNKIEANKIEIENTNFNIKALVNNVVNSLKKSGRVNGNSINLEFDESIYNFVKSDSVKISEILYNLIGNALKFTENGTVEIIIKKLSSQDNKQTISFKISDNGIGISKEKLENIFESFSQGSIQINRIYGGTGLGLTIVKNLLEMLGSKIELESEEGKGSTFSFNLSLEKGSEVKEVSLSFDNLKGKKVLIVEDVKINQIITKKILEKASIISDIVDNGLDAIEKIKTISYDLILMDINMPGISGIEATKRIRKFNTKLPIFALTAITLDDKKSEFIEVGFNDFISKPFKPEELFSKMNAVLVKN